MTNTSTARKSSSARAFGVYIFDVETNALVSWHARLTQAGALAYVDTNMDAETARAWGVRPERVQIVDSKFLPIDHATLR